jgi:hypothetical protein
MSHPTFPIGAGLVDGAFIITEHIVGTPARGLYRARKAGESSATLRKNTDLTDNTDLH